mmetsp:Transcript_12010/g.26889  ORF Transcript_12010/g.26889 Transcript_12010/m.26889 type:complete len:680 (+) Transcript_12010:24-2063(+)
MLAPGPPGSGTDTAPRSHSVPASRFDAPGLGSLGGTPSGGVAPNLLPMSGVGAFTFHKNWAPPQDEAAGRGPPAGHMRPSLERALRHVQSHPHLPAGQALAAPSPAPSEGGGSVPQSRSGSKEAPQAGNSGVPPVRGKLAIFQRLKNQGFGVASPQSWAAQLEECEAECRRDLATIAASCRALGQKFTDEDFPPSNQSLFVNGEKPSPSTRMPCDVCWRRASELCPGALATPLEVTAVSRFRPGSIDDTAFLGALSLLRAAERAPEELIVQHDLGAGVVGVRLFKDGEWTYEVVDDYLPCGEEGLACGFSTSSSEVWMALLEKANAKIHGSYEAVQRSTELEALEDLTGGAVRKLDRREASSGQDLLQLLMVRQQLDCLHLAARRRERRGEEHQCGLLSGHGYPVCEFERDPGGGQALVRLANPWPRGGYRGASGGGGSFLSEAAAASSFLMSSEELLGHFTEVLEVRVPPPSWLCYRVTLSTDRPSYPLLSSRGAAQCLLMACQPDRRWSRQDSYLNGLGLRVYRCRVRAPPHGQQGGRQDPKANPFEPLELIRRRPLGKTRSACLEFALEPHALYIVTADSQYRCPCCVLRFACSTEVQFRELSAPEAGHFLAAQPGAAVVEPGVPGISRNNSEASTEVDWHVEEACSSRAIGQRLRCGGSCESCTTTRSPWWAFGC